MSKTIDTLVSDISKLFEGHTLDEALAANFGKGLSDLFIDRFKNYGTERDNNLRMSNLGQPRRKLWYTLKGFKGTSLSADNKVKFIFGDIIECLFIFLAIEAGHSVDLQQAEIEVDGVPGHIDCRIDGVLVDVKSCSTPSFKKFVTGDLYNSDPFGYVAQLTGYKQALETERAGWLIIDKVLGHFDFVELKIDNTYDVHERIKTVRRDFDSDIPPDFCYKPIPVSKTDKTGNLILNTGCSYCEHKFYCHRDSNDGKGLQTRIYAAGPKYFVKILKEPNLKYFFKDDAITSFTYETFETKSLD